MSAPDSYRVPARLRGRFDAIIALTDAFATEHLNEDYADVSRRMAAALARKRPSPLERGEARTWAAGILYAVGWVNFLADPAQEPHMPTAELAERAGVGQSTVAARFREIRDALDLVRLEPEWTLPSKLLDNPLVWFVLVNGIPVDVRKAPRELQEEAFRQGVIPFIPADGLPGSDVTAPPAATRDSGGGVGARGRGRPTGRSGKPAAGGEGREGADRIYQLKITLDDIEPPIWRRVLVPEDTTLIGLHRIIQAAMGWQDYHLWRFEIGGEEYGELRGDDRGSELLDARRTRLNQVAAPGDVLLYEYDFGDSWEHRVRIEKALPAEPGRQYPLCIAAERAGPPEDCGGVWGYANLLKVLDDPDHPDHEEMLEWVGDDFDPEGVDLDAINRQLARTRPRESRGGWASAPAGPPRARPEMEEREEVLSLFHGAEAALRQVRAEAEEIVERTLAEDPDASIEELNAALRAATGDYNLRPKPELGGLSPVAVQRLLNADWESAESAVRLNDSLPPAEFEQSTTLYNARLFLSLLGGQGEVKGTPKGNLSRAFVAAFRERMRWPAHIPGRDWLSERKVINEDDIYPLHRVRILLDVAGLIKQRKGLFTLTRRGESLAPVAHAGELFATLFLTHFRRFNLAYLDRVGPVPGFQHTIAYVLYRFGTLGSDWRTPDELAPELILPAVRAELPPARDFDRAPLILETRFLGPLEGFALAEVRELPREPGTWRDHLVFRKTPLFDHFLSFDLTTSE